MKKSELRNIIREEMMRSYVLRPSGKAFFNWLHTIVPERVIQPVYFESEQPNSVKIIFQSYIDITGALEGFFKNLKKIPKICKVRLESTSVRDGKLVLRFVGKEPLIMV